MPTGIQENKLLKPEIDMVTSGTSKMGQKWTIYNGDAIEVLQELPDESFNCVITSPPYFWLRDYGVDGQLGLEGTVAEYVNAICAVMDEVKRVLKKDGVLFLNLGDTYYSGKGKSHGTDKKSSKRRFGLRAVDKSGGLDIGVKPKSLIGVPWRVTMEMISREWVLRSSIIWYRKYALPEAVRDRPKRSYEHIFMFAKSRKYYFDRKVLDDEEQEDMWTIIVRPKGTQLGTAPFPDELVERCLSIGCPIDGVVLNPFSGGGTTVRVALQSGRSAAGIELNPEFCQHTICELREV